VLNCKYFLVTEAERKHVRRRESLVAVACFLPGRAKDLQYYCSYAIFSIRTVPRLFLIFYIHVSKNETLGKIIKKKVNRLNSSKVSRNGAGSIRMLPTKFL